MGKAVKLKLKRSKELDYYVVISWLGDSKETVRNIIHEDEIFDTLGLDSHDQIYQEYQRTGEVYIELDIRFTG